MSWFQDFLANQILTREAKLGVDVLSGKKRPDEAALDYGTGEVFSLGVDSGVDALHGATDNVDAATQQFAEAGYVNPALQTKPEMVGPVQPTTPVNQTFPHDSSLSNQANIKLNDNTITGPQFEGYNGDVTSPANLPEPEAPGTFLGLEGKDYTKMGMQGVLAAGVASASQPPVQPSKAPVGPGMTKGNPIPMPQGGMQGVNSMVKPVQPLNSMQMTQAQGLLNPFQRDRYRRGQY